MPLVVATAASSASDEARKSWGTSADTGVVILKNCLPLGEWVMAPCPGDSPAEMLDGDVGGDPQTGDAELRPRRDEGGEVGTRSEDLTGESKRGDLEWRVPPERRVIGTEGSLSVGEELQRLLDDSLRGRRVSSRSLMVSI